MEVFVEDLYKIMNGLQVKQVVIRHIYANAKIKAGADATVALTTNLWLGSSRKKAAFAADRQFTATAAQ